MKPRKIRSAGREDPKIAAERTKRIRARLRGFYAESGLLRPKPAAQDAPGPTNGNPDDLQHGGKS